MGSLHCVMGTDAALFCWCRVPRRRQVGSSTVQLELCSSPALSVQAAEQDMFAALTNLDSLGATRHDGSMEAPCSPEPEVCQAAA